MSSSSRGRSTSSIRASQKNAPQARAPWLDGLNPAAGAELDLPDVRTLAAETVDVIVVGGGVAGLSAALAARDAGARVLLLEGAAQLGQGATGQNAGILSAGMNMPLYSVSLISPEAAMWTETTSVLLALVEEAGTPGAILSARRTGSLSLAESTTAARHLAREARARNALGLAAEMWTPAQVATATQGRLNTSTVVEALWLPNEGRIHPLTLLAHVARQARARGVTLAGGARVLSCQAVGSRGTSRNWQVSLDGDMTIAARGLILATGPVEHATSRIYALSFTAKLPEDFPIFWDAAPYTYYDYRPGDGRLTVSGGRYGRPGASPGDRKYHQRMAAQARCWLPELADAQPRYAWGVDLHVAADMQPALVERGDGAPAVAIEGLGALGVLPGIVLGRRAGKDIARRVG
jgi:glycine/D-amino acid oxidase-like deaminating enzyme